LDLSLPITSSPHGKAQVSSSSVDVLGGPAAAMR
jgi:hypothetical protein